MDRTLTKKERPKTCRSVTEEVKTECGHLYVRMGYDNEGELIEIICSLGKTGGCAYSLLEALSRAVSMGLKYGVPVWRYINQLKDIECPGRRLWPENEKILSCADGIAKVLERHCENKEGIDGK